MNERIYTARYGMSYSLNAATIYAYKSSRKNAQREAVHVNHLINKNADGRKINDERILQQFIAVVEKIAYIGKKYNHFELSANLSIFKDCEYINADKNIYCTVEDIPIKFGRTTMYSIEFIINFVFNIFALIYPYNKIRLADVHLNPSIRGIIKKYYHAAA